MGIELELGVLFVMQTVGYAIFDPFEVETKAWRKITKWTIIGGLTVGVFYWAGHWALLVPAAGFLLGGTVHFVWCRKHGIHPVRATPRRKYYQLRGWAWPE